MNNVKYVPTVLQVKDPRHLGCSVREATFKNVVDFTELLRIYGYSYLLVFVCTFSGCIKVSANSLKKASEVAQFLLGEIILHFGPLPTIRQQAGIHGGDDIACGQKTKDYMTIA